MATFVMSLGSFFVSGYGATPTTEPMTLLRDNRPLLEAFRAGQAKALTTVYRTYVQPLYTLFRHGFAVKSGGSMSRVLGHWAEHEIEELIQETFRKAFEERARMAYDGLRPYRSYLFTIARNLLIDQLRKKTPELAQTEAEALAEIADEQSIHETPEEKASQAELRQLLKDFRASLNDRERLLFDIRFAETAEQSEVQKRLGLSLYKTRLLEQHVRKSMLSFLKRHGYVFDFKESGS